MTSVYQVTAKGRNSDGNRRAVTVILQAKSVADAEQKFWKAEWALMNQLESTTETKYKGQA